MSGSDKLLHYFNGHSVVILTRGVNQVMTNDIRAKGTVVLTGVVEDSDYEYIYLSSGSFTDLNAPVVKAVAKKDIIAIVESEHAEEIMALPVSAPDEGTPPAGTQSH